MFSYSLILWVLVPTVLIGVAAIVWLAPPEKTGALRSIPQRIRMPRRGASLVVILLAMMFLASVPAVLFGVVAGHPSVAIVGAASAAAGVGLLLQRSWGFTIAYVLLAAQPAAYIAMLFRIVSFRHLRAVLLLSAVNERITPFGLLTGTLGRFFHYWGVPEDITFVALFAVLLALLAMSHAAMRQQQTAGLDSRPTPQTQRRILIGIVWLSATCIVLPIACILIVALGDLGSGSNPGGFGPGYGTFFALLFATPFAIAGAIGLAISLTLLKRLKRNQPIITAG